MRRARVLARARVAPPGPARGPRRGRADHRASSAASGTSSARGRDARGPVPAPGLGQRRVPRPGALPRQGARCRRAACPCCPRLAHRLAMALAQVSIGDPVVVAARRLRDPRAGRDRRPGRDPPGRDARPVRDDRPARRATSGRDRSSARASIGTGAKVIGPVTDRRGRGRRAPTPSSSTTCRPGVTVVGAPARVAATLGYRDGHVATHAQSRLKRRCGRGRGGPAGGGRARVPRHHRGAAGGDRPADGGEPRRPRPRGRTPAARACATRRARALLDDARGTTPDRRGRPWTRCRRRRRAAGDRRRRRDPGAAARRRSCATAALLVRGLVDRDARARVRASESTGCSPSASAIDAGEPPTRLLRGVPVREERFDDGRSRGRGSATAAACWPPTRRARLRDARAVPARPGVPPLVEGYLGEPPLLTVEKTTLRKADPSVRRRVAPGRPLHGRRCAR